MNSWRALPIGTRRKRRFRNVWYWAIKVSDDEKPGNRWQLEHRAVMAKLLGRPLRPEEIVHHRNHNTLDSAANNLELTTKSAHSKHHYPDITFR